MTNTYYVAGIPFTSCNSLAHHGIKGQKWGVRRYQNPDGTYTEAGKQRYGKVYTIDKAYKKANRIDRSARAKANAAVALPIVGSLLGPVGTIGGAVVVNTLRNKANNTRVDLLTKTNPVKNEEIVIPEGTKFSRTSLKESENENERLYVALSKAKYDMDYYGKTWPSYLRKIANNPNAKVYRNTYEVKSEIIAPSYEKRKEIADSIVSANKKLKTELGKAYAMDQLRLISGNYGAKTIKEIEDSLGMSVKNAYKFNVDAIVKNEKYSLKEDSNFREFTASIPTSGKLMNAYIKELKKQGYTAVFDDNANSFAPFIVFDSSMLEQVDSKELR